VADVFVFPSLTDTQAIVLNEAAHAGLPFVWIDSDLNAVLQDSKTGFQAQNTPASFAREVTKLLADKDLRVQFGRQSRTVAQKMTEAKQTKKMANLLDALVEKRILAED
jgi:glycosyltransferase involved in cell wall biosynthesis